MDDKEFRLLADLCLERLAARLEGFDPEELDYATTDGVVTLEFGDGARFVLNRQAGSLQMWYAADARAWHYDWDAESKRWLDDRDGHELFSNLERTISAKLGRPLEIGEIGAG